MQVLAIIFLSVIAAVSYGIVHDQITARICIEYFTIGHPPVFDTDSPTLLGFGWGIIATWWMGLIIGVPLAIAARFGSRPKQSATSLVLPIGKLLVVMAILTATAGLVGWILARRGSVFLVEPLASQVPPEKHVAFLVDVWTHLVSYIVGFFGGIALIIRTWQIRKRLARRPAN